MVDAFSFACLHGGSSGRLQDWVGQDAESPPLIRQTLPARRRRPSPKSPGDVLPLFLRHEARQRQSTPQPSNLVSIRAGVGEGRRRLRLAVGLFASFPSQKIQWVGWIMDHGSYHDDGHVRVPLTWAPFPSVAKHVSWTASNPTKRRRHFTSAGPARRYAWRTRPQPFNKNAALQPGGSPTADHRPRRKRRPPTRSAAARGMAGCSTPSRYHCLGSWEWEWEWWADRPPTPLPSLSIHRSFLGSPFHVLSR